MPNEKLTDAQKAYIKEQSDWEKLLEKISRHARNGGTMLLAPEEIRLLAKSLLKTSGQLMSLLSWVSQHHDMDEVLAEIMNPKEAESASEKQAEDAKVLPV